ncbi:MAG: hypothetical protein R2824_25490 [Saprospiraceae bacterium]|nr:hypothetical protein [Lewinella sp.]
MNTLAADRFEVYFAEKMWEMIPAIYRHEDGLATNPNPGVLRRLIEIMAEQAALLRRSHDSLWDDQFIELCNDWAVPYIADLLGTRLISAQNKRGRRIDVAKTVYYRRRKGTPRVLEELISDIAGWDGKLVENFLRLARTRHGLDPAPAPLAGRFSSTQPGGWADLRQQSASELAGGPFDEYFHTADMRRHRGQRGRYGIPKLAFHLFRLTAFKILDSTPFSLGNGLHFTFDPSGRDIPLFIRRNRPEDWDNWHSAREWELPGPMRCRLLGHEEYLIKESLVQSLINDHGLTNSGADDLRLFVNQRFRNEGRLRTSLRSASSNVELFTDTILLPLLHGALVDDCGKSVLLEDPTDPGDEASVYVNAGPPEGIVPPEQVQAGQLADWAGNAQEETRLIIDPERGRLLFRGDPVDEDDIVMMYHYGFPGHIGAGTFPRAEVEKCNPTMPELTGGQDITLAHITDDAVVNEVVQISDSKTYTPIVDITTIQDLTLQAANHERPYIRLAAPWQLSTDGLEDAQLVLDGLWIGGDGQREVILEGDYECVVIRNCTLDPGGDTDALGNTIFPLPLVIRGQIENLYVISSITGPIYTEAGGLVEQLTIEDSIVQSVDSTVPALSFTNGEVIMNRVTVFGSIDVHRLQASETLLSALSTVQDTQSGCFRFSAAPSDSRLPRAYESFLFEKDTNHWFSSRKFGQPTYGQLSETAPVDLQRGAENGSEIGAYNYLINPIKRDSLQAKIEEYMPFGLIPIFINEV